MKTKQAQEYSLVMFVFIEKQSSEKFCDRT